MIYKNQYFNNLSQLVDFLNDNHISKDRIIFIQQYKYSDSSGVSYCYDLIYLG